MIRRPVIYIEVCSERALKSESAGATWERVTRFCVLLNIYHVIYRIDSGINNNNNFILINIDNILTTVSVYLTIK